MSGVLYVVATPIGNLEDITLRALRILKEVDVIACEDTRRTKILLDRYQISKPLVSYHRHSGLPKIDQLLSELASGKSIALVTDAGTPGISDPGGLLVKKAVEQNISVVPVPGVSALLAVASVAGIAMDKFRFVGFLPHKKGREKIIKSISESDTPVIFYESSHRILKTLLAFSGSGGYLVVGRELTKKFEEIVRGPAQEVFKHFQNQKILGEFVIIFSPHNR
ncbi:MAG: 16S rRNA (cytidine(1402)-2'-O)-methyltransferase [Candidatus Doudnabacteria bacterium]|nr:16S rRNA (cytidine(1402)-2'-O)-methyltransferase [Candidatus Doudnabacteria bacterium]